jgi:hypothetical protein
MEAFTNLKRKELWKMVKQIPNYKDIFPDYRKVKNEELMAFLEAAYEMEISSGEKLEGGKLDIQKFISKLFPGEHHLPGYNFAGPGTKLDKRLKDFNPETGEYSEVITKPINELDEAALNHDIAYTKHDDLKGRHEADKILIEKATKIMNTKSKPLRQKIEAGIVKHLIQAKLTFGLGKEVENFIDTEISKFEF